MKTYIPQIEPWIDDEELIQLKRVIQSTYVTEHELTQEFEDLIKELTGARYAMALTNGTAALYCCLVALGIGPGDEVIVPNLTFIATANAVLMAGATPVFCDVLPDTMCIDPVEVECLITPRTKAVMPVHLYGQSADMHLLSDIAEAYSLKIIEDAAQGVGVKFDNKHVGTYGDLGILSFYGNKTITCGEGGVILTDNEDLRDKCYRLKNHGRSVKGVFTHDDIGYNFAFTEMQAAIGIAQMNKLARIVEKKNQIYDTYHANLKNLFDRLNPVYIDSRTTPVHWFVSFLTDYKEELCEHLRADSIGTRAFFYPLHRQPCYSHMNIEHSFEVTDELFNRGVSLPSSYHLTYENQMRIIESIQGFFNKK